MRQTLALLLDAYRELNARKMFWITLVLSGLVVGVFAAVGIDENGLTILWWNLPTGEMNLTSNLIPPEVFYKSLFTSFGVNFWLAWIATILALVSTASIVPDLISSGAIDLVLSKPISRLRLFFTKYLGGLLFVALQVTVFSGASFLVLGIRGGVWEPGLFISIPIVVIFFSYLFAICVLLGLITKSTIASLLLTLLIWFGLFILNSGDNVLLFMKTTNEQKIAAIERSIEINERSIEMWQERDPERVPNIEIRLETARAELEKSTSTGGTVRTIHSIIYGLKTILPKTSETIGLLERWLIDLAELPDTGEGDDTPGGSYNAETGRFNADEEQMQMEIVREIRARSVWWVMGTSLLFELFILGIAGWMFMRRDF